MPNPVFNSAQLAEIREYSEEAAALLKTLANDQRLRILCMLCAGEMSVGELNRQLDLSQSALSQHLAVLRANQIVKTRREAQVVYYRLGDDNAARIIAVLHDIYCAAS